MSDDTPIVSRLRAYCAHAPHDTLAGDSLTIICALQSELAAHAALTAALIDEALAPDYEHWNDWVRRLSRAAGALLAARRGGGGTGDG